MNTNTKRSTTMNNIKNRICLAGSLVTLGSAQAGDISVSGSINATMKFGKGGENNKIDRY